MPAPMLACLGAGGSKRAPVPISGMVGIGESHHTTSATPDESTYSMLTTVDVSDGDSIVVAWSLDVPGRTLSSVTDSAGNVYTVDSTNSVASSTSVGLASCHGAVAMLSGSTIIVNWTGGTSASGKGLCALKTAGLLYADKIATAGGTTTAWTMGPTSVLSQTNELVIYLASPAINARPSTPTNGGTDVYDIACGAHQLCMGYKLISDQAAQTITGNFSAVTQWTGVLVTYAGQSLT